MTIRPAFDRMMDNVMTVPEAGCWIFVGSTIRGGYGQVSTKRGSSPALAHRLSFTHHGGKIPEGMSVCHKCDTPSCVNPDHLFVGTQKENIRDMVSKGRQSKKSLLNLRPGKAGVRGAGPISMKEISHGTRN